MYGWRQAGAGGTAALFTGIPLIQEWRFVRFLNEGDTGYKRDEGIYER